MTAPLGLGIIGCGAISEAYFRACRRFPVLAIRACADRDPAAAEARAGAHGCAAMGVDELLADPAIDLVVNLTVPRAHAEIDLRALTAGKHVFSEKPLAVTRAEGEAVVALAQRRGLRVGCAPDTVLGAGIQTCRALIDQGAIGRPVAFHAHILGGGHEDWHPSPAFYYQVGGGPLFDMGPYHLHALITLLGPVRRVTAIARASFPTRTITSQPLAGTVVPVEVPTHLVAVLEFASGVVGGLTTSFDVRHGHHAPTLEIFGDQGSLAVPDPNGTGGPVRLRTAGGDWREMPLTHAYREGSRGLGVADLASAIRTGRDHRANERIALHALDIMQAIHEASDQGRHIALATTCERPAPMPADLPEGRLD